jgi:hypothetical protein
MLFDKRIRPRGCAEADPFTFLVSHAWIGIVGNLDLALHASAVSCASSKTLFKVDQARCRPSDAVWYVSIPTM